MSKSRILKRVLGRLLHRANSSPEWPKDDFYSMKERILSRFGTQRDYDLQEIPPKACWTCDGTGWYAKGDRCRRCCGSGEYASTVWVVLERWELGGYQFHKPTTRHYTKPAFMEPTIRGYVEHRDYGTSAKVASLWLALIFDRPLWLRMMTSSRYCGWRWHPLLILNWLMMEASMRRMDFRRRCRDCGRRTWSYGKFVCDRCSARPCEPLDIPF